MLSQTSVEVKAAVNTARSWSEVESSSVLSTKACESCERTVMTLITCAPDRPKEWATMQERQCFESETFENRAM